MSAARAAVTADPIPADRAAAAACFSLAAEGLRRLAAGVGDEFDRALDLLQAASGRIVVTGMGKSGHVGRKIAATFASTGAPAQFVHPAEAAHGDLGMIVRGDAVLALSNSGETAELAAVVEHVKRFALPLIAITSGVGSTLARAADVTLLLPDVPEACPNGLAPTTSTTMTLAMGDALAVALLSRRGFGPEAFRALHPAGKLGQRLRAVADVMRPAAELPLVAQETPLPTAILEMSRGRLGCVGVVDGAGRLAGILTDGDLRRHLAPDMFGRAIGEVMTRAPRTIAADAFAAAAVAEMQARAITVLFVVDGAGRPIGLVHIHDLLRAGVA